MRKIYKISVGIGISFGVVMLAAFLFGNPYDRPPYSDYPQTYWLINYEKTSDVFPRQLVNEKLSEFWNSSTTINFVVNFSSSKDRCDIVVTEHECDEKTHMLTLRTVMNKQERFEVISLLESIPDVTQVTYAGSAYL